MKLFIIFLYIKVIPVSPNITISPNIITLKTVLFCTNCVRHNRSDKISPNAKHNILIDNIDENNFVTASV